MVQDASDLRNMVADLKPADKYDFEMLRDGKRTTLGIKIGAKPEDANPAGDDAVSAPEPDDESGSFLSKKLGMRFGPLDKEARVKYSIPNDLTGVVITGVTDGSSAAENGLAGRHGPFQLQAPVGRQLPEGGRSEEASGRGEDPEGRGEDRVQGVLQRAH